MLVKDIFAKPIDRDIQGVIIAGQNKDANAAQELEEFVVTRELQEGFSDFFGAYNKGIGGKTSKVGVWIKGFFGSGKSHLLKIFSYLLENREVNGKRAIDYFTDDNKIDDPVTLANMRRAAATPADTILFNIDSRSDTSNTSQKDPMVNILLRVFNDMRGFCSENPRVADFESRLDNDGRLGEFQKTFEEITGKPWEDERPDFLFVQDDIVNAVVRMGYMSEAAARNLCNEASGEYRINSSQFAEKVRKYLDSKGKDHHIVFLIDEVGQYIGENTNLMLSLQTAVEDLATACEGRAWIVVTSQEAIDRLVNVQSRDFSKILGRFETKINLSSTNVDEVVKRRVLDKTDSGTKALVLTYDENRTAIGNLITFNDSVEKKMYAGRDDFASVYPFVPYQFDILGKVLEQIRDKTEAGKHMSDGARSMLAFFQESAGAIQDEQIGALVAFYRFYDALEDFLDHNHKGVIRGAYKNTKINPQNKDDVFAVNVLKTLFLIKYVLQIDANIDNITSLMVSDISNDRITLKNQTAEALDALKKQKLIEENGTFYKFLTDEEQEINRAISNLDASQGDITNKTASIIFEEIFKDESYQDKKFGGRYVYPITRAVDDSTYKIRQNAEIGLRILTPLSGSAPDKTALTAMSREKNEVLVILPDSCRFSEDVTLQYKIEEFLRLNAGSKQAGFDEVRKTKTKESAQRKENAKASLTEGLRNAVIYVNGAEMESGENYEEKIKEGLLKLIQAVFYKHGYIDTAFKESDIHALFKGDGQESPQPEEGFQPNKQALDEVLAFIGQTGTAHAKVTMKAVKDQFMKSPYGFVADDVHWLVAKLFRRGDILFTVNGQKVSLNNTKPEDLIRFIIKKEYVESLRMEKRTRVSEQDKKTVRGIYKEFFGVGTLTGDEDAAMTAFQNQARTALDTAQRLAGEYDRYAYPGKGVLDAVRELMGEITRISDPQEFFSVAAAKKDEFLELSDKFSRVKGFFKGEQRGIFADALDALRIYDEAKTYISDDAIKETIEKIAEITALDELSSKDFTALLGLNDKFSKAYGVFLENERKPVLKKIDEARKRVEEELAGEKPAGAQITDDFVKECAKQFADLRAKAESTRAIPILRSFKEESDALKMKQLKEIDTRTAAKSETAKKVTEKSVSISQITGTATWRLESKDDVEKFITDLKQRLLAELEKAAQEKTDIVNVEF